jgi:hypothetical protein
MEVAEGNLVKIKAFGENGDRLKGLAVQGKILNFEALRADELKFKAKTPFEFELNFLKCSEMKEVEEKEETECEYDFTKMETGKKYIVECFVNGQFRDIGEGLLGAKIVDKIGNKAELHIKSSLGEIQKKIGDKAAAYKVTMTALAKGSKGVNLTVQNPTDLTDVVPWTEPLPRKRQFNPSE